MQTPSPPPVFHLQTKGFTEGVLYLFFIVLLLFSLSACALRSPGQQKPEPPAPVSENESVVILLPAPRASESPYYYYTEAQIRLNRNRPLEAIGFLRQAAALDPQSAFLQQELAAILVRTGQPQAALQAIRKSLELDPEDPETLIVFAGIQQMLEQDIKELIPIYEKVIALDPDRERIYLILGNLYLAQKKTAKAEAVYRDLIARHPENYAGYYYLGQLLALLERPDEALENFDIVIEKAPYLLEPYLERINILSQRLTRSLTVEIRKGDTLDALLVRHSGRPTPALRRQVMALNPQLVDMDHLEKGKKILLPPRKNNPEVAAIQQAYTNLLTMNPESVEIRMDHALFLYQTGREDAAMEAMALLNQEETREEVIRRIFSVFVENKRYSDAIFLLEGLRSQDMENGEIRYALGLVHEETGKREKARSFYASIDPADPVFRKAVIHLAYIDSQSGNIDKGIEILEKAHVTNPYDATLRLYLGAFYEEADRLEDAADIFRDSLEKDPEDHHVRYRLGIVLDRMDKKEAAMEQMAILIDQNPDHANALNYLGYTLTEMEIRLDEAEAMIRRAMELKPGDGYITDSMGWVYFKQGKPEKALPYLEKAARLLPEDPVILDHLGDAYRSLGKRKAAVEAYKKSLQFKEAPEVREKLEALSLEIEALP
ncbi:tetratricopeptide repeat protein [Desulfobotulus alkaliphilus]|uniref:Tetratricopeptide repeat protein n=1 Tax=Desulfobotulus alkaliphilus TaxID=622671 RepID=A0A562S7E8_9BACT|nr:tetratricopeptide repeat protein [Desulfobotulus alkaliphilus]TWI77351.1 tetratricopeptide repeat protein [Desulfobotulus alkaliphilus]